MGNIFSSKSNNEFIYNQHDKELIIKDIINNFIRNFDDNIKYVKNTKCYNYDDNFDSDTLNMDWFVIYPDFENSFSPSFNSSVLSSIISSTYNDISNKNKEDNYNICDSKKLSIKNPQNEECYSDTINQIYELINNRVNEQEQSEKSSYSKPIQNNNTKELSRILSDDESERSLKVSSNKKLTEHDIKKLGKILSDLESSISNSNSPSVVKIPINTEEIVDSITTNKKQTGGSKRYRRKYQKGGSGNICGRVNYNKYDEKSVDLKNY